MYIFTMPAEEWDELNLNPEAISLLVDKHHAQVPELHKLLEYYEGHHKILTEDERENKLVCNHAKDIADTASAYFIGNPVKYQCEDEDLQILTEMLDHAGADEADGDNGIELSIYGRAYDYTYIRKDQNELAIRNLSPENTFIVYDDSIEQNELFAVYYYVKKDDTERSGKVHYIATVLTQNFRYELDLEQTPASGTIISGPEAHNLGQVPVTEYLNNKLGIGDYELQIPLIDAYNGLMSDRITDKEQFIDAILAIYGTLLSDDDADEEGDGNGSSEAMKRLRKEKLLEMPGTAKAEYLTRTFDENGVEILKKAIEQDIHKFSHVPCMTDEAFGGNVSGVAMEFKLLGLENITKIKTRYYRKGLRKRLRIFCDYMQLLSRGQIDPMSITATFTRALPKNLLEISQFVVNLRGTVSRKTLLAQIPFVEDPDAEIAAVDEENAEAVRQQQELFAGNVNDKPEELDEDEIPPKEEDE